MQDCFVYLFVFLQQQPSDPYSIIILVVMATEAFQQITYWLKMIGNC